MSKAVTCCSSWTTSSASPKRALRCRRSLAASPFPTTLFPTGLLQPIGSTQGLATNLGLGIGAQYLNRPLPYSHQFSFGVQRALPGGWVSDVSYVGNLTKKRPVSANLNFINTQELNRLPVAERAAYFNAQVPNPMAGLLPGSAFNGATIVRSQLLNAYPHFSQVSISNIPIGSQSYHSLQMKATRRFASGLSAQVSYTWAKTLERVSLLNAQDVNVANLLNSPPGTALAAVGHPAHVRGSGDVRDAVREGQEDVGQREQGD